MKFVAEKKDSFWAIWFSVKLAELMKIEKQKTIPKIAISETE